MIPYHNTVILGAGVTGLAAGAACGAPVFEAREVPGGICSSYYMRAGDPARYPSSAAAGPDAYRFEYGGGHWIFGGDPAVLHFIDTLTPTRTYTRRSSVFLPEQQRVVPYPIQNHLSHLGPDLAQRAVHEILSAPRSPVTTMAEWLEQSFGPTLMELFFASFHERYTAGLWTRIAPQDAYKSPDSVQRILQGAASATPPVGYNVSFRYPQEGLDTLAQRLADRGRVQVRKRVTRIDTLAREVWFEDGAAIRYGRILSTLPLNVACALAGVSVDAPADPYTSVLVVNIGAKKGPRCPDDHWLYIPTSRSGIYRVGFYSHVEPTFLPEGSRARGDRVSIYAEQAFLGGRAPDQPTIRRCGEAVVQDLRAWGFITEAEVVDPTWIEVAYTWSWAGSCWRPQALEALRRLEIFQVGRYARWVFQGIADSIRDGLAVGAALRDVSTEPKLEIQPALSSALARPVLFGEPPT